MFKLYKLCRFNIFIVLIKLFSFKKITPINVAFTNNRANIDKYKDCIHNTISNKSLKQHLQPFTFNNKLQKVKRSTHKEKSYFFSLINYVNSYFPSICIYIINFGNTINK